MVWAALAQASRATDVASRDQRSHPLDGVTFVAFDTETTGFNARGGRVVEIAGVKFTLDGKVHGAFQSLINPGMPIPYGAMRVHGITDEDVHGQPDARHVLSQFFSFLDGPDTVLVAHNAPFDINFLRHEIARHDLRVPQNRVMDTLTLSRRYFRHLPNHRLATVARSLGLAIELEHRAFPDSLLVKGILTRVFKELEPQRAVEEMGRSRLRLAMPYKTPVPRSS